MNNYEKIRADVSKQFKNEMQQLKLEIIKLQNENTDLLVENVTLKNKIREYEIRLNNISDSQRPLLSLTEAIKYLT